MPQSNTTLSFRLSVTCLRHQTIWKRQCEDEYSEKKLELGVSQGTQLPRITLEGLLPGDPILAAGGHRLLYLARWLPQVTDQELAAGGIWRGRICYTLTPIPCRLPT